MTALPTADNPSTIDRLLGTVVNGFEVARYGGLRTEEDPAPFDVVEHRPMYRLRSYFPDARSGRAPVLLVPPLMQVAEIWDISPATSAVRMLDDHGVDPWVIDFGDPAVEPGGERRTFGDHVVAVAEAVARIREITGRDVHVGGYSQGGLFSYMAAAYLGSVGVASVFVLGTPVKPVDVEGVVPETLFWDLTRAQGKLLVRTGLPRWFVTQMFNWMTPHRTIRNDLAFLFALHDRESLLPREPQRKFLKSGAWLGWSGPAIGELLDVLGENRLIEGGAVIAGRTVGLADLTCPILIFIGEADVLGPAESVRAVAHAAPKAPVYECVLPVGHFGLPVSSHAKAKTWPGIASWTRWTAGTDELPDYVHRLTTEQAARSPRSSRGVLSNLTYGVGLAAGAALAAPQTVAGVGTRVVSTVLELSREAAMQAPRLLRLESMGPRTRISYSGLLDELADAKPDRVAFLFADRAHSYTDAKQRIDSVVRGLLHAGIRKGDRVGILMDMRPSALVALAALNRIGAVAVLHRPRADLEHELRLARVRWIITDPEHAAGAVKAGVSTLVLGGVQGERRIPAPALDLEQIEPDEVRVPAWFQPNPGRARDLAFVLFTGAGGDTRADLITNGRWAVSAMAAASACGLTPSDTIYSISPLHHPAGLLLGTAAATASGCRLALATAFDPETFWAEVRRYGATVVTYTRSMLHPLVSAPPHPQERHHPIRLLVGSGMPAELWQDVVSRFESARVLELYASTRSDAMLADVSGRKIGAVGRPLPGTPRTRIVAMDGDTIRVDDDGYAVLVRPGEVGQLLVDARADTFAANDIALRGVFDRDDAWIASGDLFRVDGDGDYWFVESISLRGR